ncbi:hypothetical protein ACIB24_05685 [Spongisporangium articulatum]|uniref:Uncharacterized protein n=1 Tax=Spongisporangium articulatum TaxID=3362603 RepID=A0ABW8AJL3_9ACTN
MGRLQRINEVLLKILGPADVFYGREKPHVPAPKAELIDGGYEVRVTNGRQYIVARTGERNVAASDH